MLSPVLAAIALGIRFTMGTPIVFRQVRAGRDRHAVYDPEVQDDGDARCVLLQMPNACRGMQMGPGVSIPRFVAFVRRTGLDELPQLVNILRGEMSFIGPRPLMVRYIPRYTADQRRRHSVLPGVSGWARVKGRTDLSWDARLALDI